MSNTIISVIKSSVKPSMDPRGNQKRHNLTDIVVISICSILCGGEGWYHMEYFGKCKESWFRKFLELPNGIPSEQTFMRVISSIYPDDFSEILTNVSSALSVMSCKSLEEREENHIAIDGKTARHSFDNECGKSALYLVSAYTSNEGLTLGQIATSAKSNEITAIPELLDIIEINDSVVTIDAMGC